MNLGLIVALCLVLLLGLKTVLRSESGNNQQMDRLNKGINMVIVPLIIIFIAIVTYKVFTLVGVIQ
ncbi:MAG: hypothetical protein ABFC91_02305 [Methanobacteriaceae archaeon]